MDHEFGAAATELRAELRALVHEHLPTDFLGAFTPDPADMALTRDFCRMLADKGLLTLTWPSEYGGQDGSAWDQTVVREEMWAHHEPRGPQYMGLNWVGPAIMQYGTDEQKTLHLPNIASGNGMWCQGFSEPEAGSDLASLRTRAEEVEDGWRISGQKIWTSYAPVADWCMLAARTSREDKKQNGITLFLVPMDRPGIEVRPIDSLLGSLHLNEVFLDNVPVTAADVLGPVGDGWRVMRHALAHERIGIARYARCDRLLAEYREWADPDWSEVPTTTKAAWAAALMSARTARLLAYRAVHDGVKGDLNDAGASRARIAATLGDQQTADFLGDALEARLFDDATTEDAPAFGAFEDHWRYAQAATVASGTLEIQYMLVARELLSGAPHGS
jgi:alkylation response protein AidB-like acyl-CoA dehydrogenase